MPIQVPGKRFGKRLRHSKVFGHGIHAKKNLFADLLITPLVDMFVIIVLFLIANFSATGEILAMTKDIQLPAATHVRELEIDPVVMIARDHVSNDFRIILDGQAIIENGADLAREDYLNIPSLEEKLRELRKSTEANHAGAGKDDQALNGEINIQADKDVTFKIVKRVMFSCSAAGYGNINFAVINAGSTEKATAPTASAK